MFSQGLIGAHYGRLTLKYDVLELLEIWSTGVH
jgi:hypothetical protein